MKILIIGALTAAVIFGCTPATEITGSWKNANVNPGSINKILVAAVTNRTNARQTIENDVTAAFQQNGYAVVKSMDVLPPTFTAKAEPDREVLLDKINGTEVDAILTIALLNKETENRYVPGDYRYEPVPRFGYYGRFWGYYSYTYPMVYSPGYYTEDDVYFLETNLYDATTEELLWSAQSETYNPGNLASFSKDFAAVVIDKMEEDGVIKKN